MDAKYPYKVTQEDGAYLVQFADIPEAFTEGETLEEAHFNAAEVLSLVLESRIENEFDVPRPGKSSKQFSQACTPEPAVQAALLAHWCREDASASLADVARMLQTSWAAAQKLEKPGGNPTIKKLNTLAASMGKKLVLAFE